MTCTFSWPRRVALGLPSSSLESLHKDGRTLTSEPNLSHYKSPDFIAHGVPLARFVRLSSAINKQRDMNLNDRGKFVRRQAIHKL